MLKTAIILVSTALFFLACGKKSDDAPPRTMPAGDFAVSSPVCVSSNETPVYPDLQHPVLMHDFTNLTSHTLKLEESKITEVFKDADCTLTLSGSAATNNSGYFSRSLTRSYTFEPEGCTLSVTAGATGFETGASYSTIFDGSEETAQDIMFVVESLNDVFTLKSIDEEPVRSHWATYGCQNPDQLQLVWTKS